MGRPKKNKDIQVEPVTQTVINGEPVSEIENLLSGYTENIIVNDEPIEEPKKKGRPKKGEQQENTIQADALINGALFLLLIDVFIPNIICFLNNKYNKKKIKPSRLQMSSQQRADLEPVANAVAQQLMIKASPVTVFLLSLLGIYGVNYMALISD